MPRKTPNITDVNQPNMVKPSSTARPILVTNHSDISKDPMLNDGVDAEQNQREVTTAPEVSRTAKTIQPLAHVEPLNPRETNGISDDDSAPVKAAQADIPAEEPPDDASTKEPTTDPEVPTGEPAAEGTKNSATKDERDPQAAQEAAKTERSAALEARHQELEKLIEEGTYAVPINAVQRQRSRLFVIVMSVLALLLAVAVCDVLLDAGMVKAPSGIPHTHFFRP